MGKRAHGEGSVYQRKDGRWVASIVAENGKRKSIYCKTQKEAVKAARQANNEKEKGILLTTADQSVEDFLRSWLVDTAQPRLRDRTYIRYRGLIEIHIIPYIGHIKLRKLVPQHLQSLYNAKLKEGCAPQSVKHIHRLLHKALNDALRWELVARNVCKAIDAPRVPRHEIQVLNAEQAQQLLQAAKGDRFEALYVVALTTGMRQGELLGLKWEDISLAQEKLQVRRTVARIGHKGFIFAEPKTTGSRRNIHLTTLAIDAFKRHRMHQNAERLCAGRLWENNDLVFCNSHGKPLEVGNVTSRSFRPILKKAGLPIIRFHDLRHSAASLLLSMNVHPKIVQELLGHSNISITMDTYSHMLPSLQEQAISQLNNLLLPEQNVIAVKTAVNDSAMRQMRDTEHE